VTRREGIICAGNWIVDLVHEIAHWPSESDLVRINSQDMGVGGGAANVVTALTKLETGLSLWPMGAIGQDDFGKFITAHCHELGLPTHLIMEKPDTATAHTHVMSVTGKSRTFFYQGGSNDMLSDQDFPPCVFETHRARIFYLGYLTLLADLDRITDDGSTPAATVLSRARAAGITTCVDLVSVDRPDFSDIIAAAIPQIDYLILNEVELARASGQTPPVAAHAPDMQDMIRMATALITAGVRRAVVVHCPQTALWVGSDGQVSHVPAVPLPREHIASPLGAGDTFCAGILYALHEGWKPQRALELGHAIARASLRGITAAEAIPNLNQLTDQLDRQTNGITT
jgi:sugar/nucleoside kinase (ribokinase family)